MSLPILDRGPLWLYWAVTAVAIVVAAVLTWQWAPAVGGDTPMGVPLLVRLWIAPVLCLIVSIVVTAARRQD